MLSSLPSASQELRHIEIALHYEGHQEVSYNSSPFIDRMLRKMKVPQKSSYCAAFVAFCLDSAQVTQPKTRSGMAQAYITRQSISASKVLRGEATIPAGSIVVWKRGTTPSGHVGFTTLQWKGVEGYTIEANTSPGNTGSQYNGDGIFQRRRSITPGAAFRITHFTLVSYD
jgi:hypothetical protein